MGSIISTSSSGVPMMDGFINKAMSSGTGQEFMQIVNFDPQQYLINSIFKNQRSNEVSLKDVNIQTSTYGRILPEVFGLMRIAGNVIWSTKIFSEKIYSNSQFSKTSSAQTTSEVKTYASFAIAVCKGSITSINAIYADEKLIDLHRSDVKIYLGSDDQKPDPTMESFLGIGNVPAFKNMAYVVFAAFRLEEYGGRIPSFTFDVFNAVKSTYDARDLIQAINIIPGSGEFVYDTIPQQKIEGDWIFGKLLETKRSFINRNTANSESDAVIGVNDLLTTFPNLKWVSVVVSWFANSLDAGICDVYPACENKNILTSPDLWSVAAFNRENAKIVGRDLDGNMRYGGTPSDNSVLRFVKELKKRNLKVCIYPMLMMDVPQKPWRGRLKASSSADIDVFFQKYNTFINHYASLLKDEVDAFIVGSEMIGLTSFCSNDTYPAVNAFVQLAKTVKQILQPNCLVTYAADWSEYHHDSLGNYNMDELWSSPFIDVVGIDAYFPLTLSTDSVYSEQDIVAGWTSGEGYDFYYEDSQNKLDKKPLNPEWAWKNIQYFWENYHYKKDGTKTTWVPKLKKIWFTEYGFPSTDCATNQPNVFYSKGSSESSFPYLSQGLIDFKAQNVAIAATERKWKNSEMVEMKFLYCWDARPYPAFPSLSSVWQDSPSWQFSHAVNGKLSAQGLSAILYRLCVDAGLAEEEFDTSLIVDAVGGYLIDKKTKAIDCIRDLAMVFDFDISLSEGKIIFKKKSDCAIYTLDTKNLITTGNQAPLQEEISSTINIPTALEFFFLDVNKKYTIGSVIVSNDSFPVNNISYTVKVPIPMISSDAKICARKILYNMQHASAVYKFTVPSGLLNLKPLDYIEITEGGLQKCFIQIENIEQDSLGNLTCSGFSKVNLNDKYNINLSIASTSVDNPNLISPSAIYEVFEVASYLDEYNSNSIILQLAVSSPYENWTGCSVYYSEDGQNFIQISNVTTMNTVGQVISNLSVLNNKSPFFIDNDSKIVVTSYGLNDYKNVSDSDFLLYRQLALVGDEIVAFKNYKQISKNSFEISSLIRGLFNTESKMDIHKNGERFVMLNNAINKVNLPLSTLGKTIYIKIVSFGQNITEVNAISYLVDGSSVKNFNSLYLLKNLQINGDVLLSWNPRSKIKASSLLVFKQNTFILKVYNKNTQVHYLSLNSNEYLYKYEDIVKHNNSYQNISFSVEELISI